LAWGWRYTFLSFGLANLVVCLPLHWFALPAYSETISHQDVASRITTAYRPLALLGFVYGTAGLIYGAFNIHLVDSLKSLSISNPVYVASLPTFFAAVTRASQVILGHRMHPLTITLAAMSFLLLALICITGGTWWPAIAFSVAYGLFQGLFAVARIGVPLWLFQKEMYPLVAGWLARRYYLAQAIGPILFASAVGSLGVHMSLALAAILVLASLVALAALKPVK
jgi:predicted MFS family arabinose efflux permease